MSAYFLGGFSKEGRGKNGLQSAVVAAAKSWSLGIPVTLLFLFRVLYEMVYTLFLTCFFVVVVCLLRV